MIEELKNIILSKHSFLNDGFINVFKDEQNGYLRNLNGELVGVEDTNGNYFYIREEGKWKINLAKRQITSCAETQDILKSYRIVFIVRCANPEKLFKCILKTLIESHFQLTFQEAELNKAVVIFEEYGEDLFKDVMQRLRDNITIISIDFSLLETFTPSQCDCENPIILCQD
ncbi:MAG: hypothetical protein ACEQSR_03735 [Candidatus Methylacidiphilales bacterium]